MRGDENRNIDVPSKVKAFRQDFPPDKAAVLTTFEVRDIADVPAVVGHATVVLLNTNPDGSGTVLAKAAATRGLRPPVPGAQGMKDTRDAERAMTGAVGRALFLMGYGEKADDSADYEAEEDPDQWFRDAGWSSKWHHDDWMADAKAAVTELPPEYEDEIKTKWHDLGFQWPLTKAQFTDWRAFLLALRDRTKAGTGGGDAAGGEPPPAQPPLEDAVGPDAPLVKR